MRIRRILPPAAAPLSWRDLSAGFQGWMRGCHETQKFTEELKIWFNCRHCFLVSSGKAALTLTLLAIKEAHPERDQVLIPAYTCYSVPSAIVRAGLKVCLCDIDSTTLDFDDCQLREKIVDPRLLCVVPIHLFGMPADIDRLRTLIKDPEVVIIEDASQAMGSEHNGYKLGTLGDVGFFSLGRGKALTTVEGGVILTNRDDIGRAIASKFTELGEYCFSQRLFLFLYAIVLWALARPILFWVPKGLPFLRLGETVFDPNFPMRKMAGLQAGLARNWQFNLAAMQKIRRTAVRFWQASLPFDYLSSGESCPPPLLRFPVVLASRESARAIFDEGTRQGLGIAFSYPEAVHRVPELAEQFHAQDFPVAADMACRLVTLPVHGYVTNKDRLKILLLFSS